MCLIFISIHDHPQYKLIVAANRDEFYARKTAALSEWHDHPGIIGGRDLQAQGTWMAMAREGKIGMVTYGYVDTHPHYGASYYRLKQTDFNGSTSFSNIVKVDLGAPDQILVYPNPVARSTTALIDHKGSFALFNSMGQRVLVIDNNDELDTRGLPSGVYTLKSSDGRFTRLVIE